MKMTGKVAAVTGGSRGIGRAIVEAFLAEGAYVAFSGRDADKGARALEELDAGERALFSAGDVRSPDAVNSLLDAAVARWGRLDVMVNNAGGITAPAPIAELDDEAWANDLAWNLSTAKMNLSECDDRLYVSFTRFCGSGWEIGKELGRKIVR